MSSGSPAPIMRQRPAWWSPGSLYTASRVILINLLVFVALFLATELGYRILHDGFPGAFFRIYESFQVPYSNLGNAHWVIRDEELGYRLNPAREHVNSRSVSHRAITVPKPAGLYRIIFLGDSVTAAWPGFVSHIDQRLQEMGDYEVINAGTPGYTSYQEVLFFAKYLAATEPDLVVWGYCLNDNHKFLHRFNEHGNMLLTDEAMTSMRIDSSWDRLASRSYLLSLARLGLVSRAQANEVQSYTFPWEASQGFNVAWKDYSWSGYEREMQKLLNHLRPWGGRLAVVILPYEPQMFFPQDHPRHDYVVKPQRKLMELCREYEVPCLDLYPTFMKAYSRVDTLYTDGVHLDENGHRLTAEMIGRFLKSRRLLIPAE